ncbi:GIY-YIG nuclease family protein, partial [Bacteroides heparinolyticus]|uniref:GIY-YIG nuclease family protein n=1 Tax=Prevotella heparinolytica TaxID=28113 RepID=UPI0035A11ABD
LTLTVLQRKQDEMEQQRAIKEQMREEEKVRKEIELEKKKIEKEVSQFAAESKKLMDYLAKANSDIERNLYADKIKELEEKIKLLEEDKKRVFEREANTRAGFVYVISNIGSFGEDVYKIGMTRRLEPMDRVKELSDASVPFEFDVHAMIFSDDAPALEALLHQTFKDKQVNKVNPRKEFYKVSLTDIAELVKKEFNATTEFTMLAEAAQYRESLRIAETSSATA